MALKLPEQDKTAKLSSFLQLIAFLVLFFGAYLPLRRLIHSVLLRILVLFGVYFVTSLVIFLVIRPLMMRLEAKLRRKKK